MRTKLAVCVMVVSAVMVTGGTSVAVAGTGPAEAGPAGPAGPAGAAGTAGPAGTAGARAEHLRFMNTRAAAVSYSAIATGAFTAGGFVIPARVTDRVVFPGGTFKFKHFTQSDKIGFNPATCLITETERGHFTIGSGTGRYAGLRGSGKFVDSIVAVTAKNRAGQCTHVRAPGTFQEVTTANGTVSG